MRRSCWNRDCVQEADAFSARFIEKLAPTAACCAQGATVIHPRHRGRTEEDHLKLKGPHRPFQRQPCALIRCEAIAVKLHMPRLIPQQKVAHLCHDGGCHVPAEQVKVAPSVRRSSRKSEWVQCRVTSRPSKRRTSRARSRACSCFSSMNKLSVAHLVKSSQLLHPQPQKVPQSARSG